jgi:hypothetical protein
MEPHRKKQVFAVALVSLSALLIILAVTGKSLYVFFRPTPPPEPEILPVELLWARAFPGEKETAAKPFIYDAAARVRNRTQEGIERIEYKFELLDAEGAALVIKSGESYLRGNEAKYVIENSLETERPAARVRFIISGLSRGVAAEAETPIILRNREYQHDTVRGVVLNQSAVAIGRVDVAALLFDGVGNPIRARQSHFTRLLPHEERGFELHWNNPGRAASAEVEIGTNMFNRDNYLLEASGTPPIQP